MPVAELTLHFFRRELSNRFSGSLSGGVWALLQPLLQLAITSLVFVYVFKVRVPGENPPSFIAFFATAFWPWTAFSEAILRSTTSIHDNAALIGKVALPREILVVASVATSFALHLIGFVTIMIVLALAGQGIVLQGLLPALLLYIPLACLALGFALICAAVQVFVRDLIQILGQLLQLLMFAAPVYYDRQMLPQRVQAWVDLQPFTFYAETFRAFLLHHGVFEWHRLLIALLTAGVVLLIGHWVFRRLDPHFEDFL